MEYQELSKENFFNNIKENKLDVIINSIGNWPYTTMFKYRSGKIFGKIVDYIDNAKKYSTKSKYYIFE
jgi:hypothetical protein